ncbi:putative conserved oligomeric Golgi complex subunit 3 [Apostichopus japonicus]|uniref:Conserved oligomeric Golgi complex subunit 3 n=1 Tax=Stichopus japonicus TaxID=307972 RepID=A0A2G8L6F5_STIJA|nr:putative conserved oligomeric Golgi complex subunit 3 [Apostichopus japonicus]
MASQKVLRENLSHWDHKNSSLAPLNQVQRDSIMELTTVASSRPLPMELPLDEPGSVSQKLSMVGMNMSTEEDPFSQAFASLEMKDEKINNAQQFFAWINKVESKMEEDEEQPYKVYCDQLHHYRQQCQQVLDEVSSALNHLSDLQQQYVHVSTKTNALHEACEESMNDQTELVNKAETISSKLSYFNELERINQKLSSPAFSVTSEGFVPLLTKLDECIIHITSNPNYKEYELYKTRLHQCLSKVLSLVKTTVFNTLQQATQQVRPKTEQTVNPSENAFTLFLESLRTKVNLMDQIEQRLGKSPEYQTLLKDCHQCYFQQRQQLLGPSIFQAVTELATKHSKDHCALVRSGCAFMAHVCEDEHQLFFHFFSQPTEGLDEMLEGLCMSLYDVLRPLIIHINHLETLAELCGILKNEMLQDHVLNNAEELGAFGALARQMLEDVQERLVYRASVYVRTDILSYQPAPGDLAYPEKLEMMKSIAESLQEKKPAGGGGQTATKDSDNESVDSATSKEVANINETASSIQDGQSEASAAINGKLFTGAGTSRAVRANSTMSPADLHGMWYPTVRRTLVCLSKLYRCIDRSIFQGLSQEILQCCIQSLLLASDSIVKKKSEVDGELFLIKHLLILREQIAPFQVEFAIKETSLDFSSTRNAAMDFFNKKGRLFSLGSNNSVLEFLLEGAPLVTEYYVDSKKDVDNQLKKTCEGFIRHCTHVMTLELTTFLTKAEVVKNIGQEGEGPKVSLRSQPFANPEKLRDIVGITNKQIKSLVSVIFEKMSLYLANKDTEYILFRPVKTNIQQSFQRFEVLVKDNYTEEDQQIIGCPSAEQVNLLLSASP